MKVKFLAMTLVVLAFASVGKAQAGSRDIFKVFSEITDLKEKGDIDNIYRAIGGGADAPASQLQFLAEEVFILRRSNVGSVVSANFRMETTGTKKTVYLLFKNSYPVAKPELKHAWIKSEFRISDELTDNGLLSAKSYNESSSFNGTLHQASVRLFDISLLSEKKLKKLIKIMKASEDAAIEAF